MAGDIRPVLKSIKFSPNKILFVKTPKDYSSRCNSFTLRLLVRRLHLQTIPKVCYLQL